MPRIARVVFPTFPHHVTQRGNRRAQVFFSRADHLAYLDRMREYTALHGVAVLAYCLMPNHVHFVLVPPDPTSLDKVMRPVTMRHAQRLNRARETTGVVWQGRYFSSVLGGSYLWNTIRYVERNPVRARLIDRAENYEWSSAAPHCGLRADELLTSNDWQQQLRASIPDWSAWLAVRDPEDFVESVRQNSAKGLPCGPPEFIDELERTSGRRLRPGRRGRPPVDPSQPDTRRLRRRRTRSQKKGHVPN